MRCRAREIAHGSKIVAMSAPLATHLLITARSSGGLSLLLIETDSAATRIDVHTIAPSTTAGQPTCV
jgi:alkylation response protein AidB-like acyl-CoA dehydrogenase